ncbi:hemin uptake protein HemP [Hoeflea sp. AS60]|uniref:hemin uptake protein HemP n=1 Tax=Hoeflea sp. AS60 TaxID=3135780 RepID=UPI0031706A34
MRRPHSEELLSAEPDTTRSVSEHPTPAEAEALAKAIPSSTLFQNRREITIAHDGSLYRLRITRQGKLILNK